jgi:hypothetical protein
MGSVLKSYMRIEEGLPIPNIVYEEMRKYFIIYLQPIPSEFPYM